MSVSAQLVSQVVSQVGQLGSEASCVIGRAQTSEPTAELQDVVVQLPPEKAFSQLYDLLGKTNEGSSHRLTFFIELIKAFHDKKGLIDIITREKFSPSAESNLFILKAVMIRHPNGATDYHGPHASESIKGLIDSRTKRCPGCRVDIEKIVSFRDYLVKIKEDINDSIKNSDNKNKLNSLIDQLIGQCDLRTNEDVNQINESLQQLLRREVRPSQATDDFSSNLIRLQFPDPQLPQSAASSDASTARSDAPAARSDAPTEGRLCADPSFLIPVCFETICHSTIFVGAILNSDQSQSQTALASLLVAATAIRILGGFCLSSDRNKILVTVGLAESMIFSSTIGILANSWEEHGIFPWQNGFERPDIAYSSFRGTLYAVCLCSLCFQALRPDDEF